MMDKRPVDYKMSDPRWRDKPYTIQRGSNQTIGNSGCGPTAMADVLATFVDPEIKPPMVARSFVERGFRTKDSGTAYGAFKYAFKVYKGKGFSKFASGKNMKRLQVALDGGALAVCLMGPGYWTKSGHYICVFKIEDGYVYACDPGSKNRKKQAAVTFKKECRRMFVFYPGKVVS